MHVTNFTTVSISPISPQSTLNPVCPSPALSPRPPRTLPELRRRAGVWQGAPLPGAQSLPGPAACPGGLAWLYLCSCHFSVLPTYHTAARVTSAESITPLQRLTTHGAGPLRVTGARPGPSQPRSAFLDLQNWAHLQFSRSTTSQTLVASTKVSKNIPKICVLVTLTDLLKGVNKRTAFIRHIHVPKTQEDFTVNLTQKSPFIL